MGALTSIRKRGDDSTTLNLKSPVSNSLVSEFRASKKPRLLLSASDSAIDNRPASVNAVSKYCSYPVLNSRLKREPHAPVRTRRVWKPVSFRRAESGVSWVANFSQVMGNLHSRYQSTKRSAIETLRFTQEDIEIIGIDKENENDVVSEDSSVEEVEILDDSKDHKLKEGVGPVEDKTQKLNGMIVERERDSRPSSSSAVTDLTYGNLKVESTEKLLESLQLDGSDARVHEKLLYLAEKRNAKLSSLNFEIELNEKKWQREQLLRPQKKEEVVEKLQDVAAEAFKPLTEEEEAEVSRALSNSSRRKLLVTHESSNISITGELLQCLRPGAWLNDEVINLYLELLKEREKREPQKFLKCHFFNTFFYKKLVSGRGYDFQSVRRWTSKRKLGYCLYDCDKIFIPIHKQVHWCLAVINKKDEKFQYLDSLGGVDSQVMKAIMSEELAILYGLEKCEDESSSYFLRKLRYFVDEVKDKSGKDIDVSSWQKEFVEDLPEQENGFDCGVFMIKYADFYSRDIGLCFSQEHMPYFRQRTAKEILSLKAE